MLGYEASRDLEETTVQGVRIGINQSLHASLPPDHLMRFIAIADQYFQRFSGQAQDWIHAYTARGIRHDRRPSDSVPVCSPLTPSCTTDHGYSDAPVYHLGLYREKVSLQPVECQSRRARVCVTVDSNFRLQIIQSYRRNPQLIWSFY